MGGSRLLAATALAARCSDGGNALSRTSTGVPGLDPLVEGGFPVNRAVAVCGGAGTGKTTLGLQFVADGIQRGEGAAFVAADEKPRHLLEEAACLGLDVGGSARLALLDASPYFTATRGGSWTQSGVDASQVAGDLVAQVRRVAARRLVIDSLTSLVPPQLDRGRVYDYVRSLMQSLEDNLGCTILVTARRPPAGDPQGIYEAIRCLVTGIVELRIVRHASRRVRTLCVTKMRGTALDLAERPFRIERGAGITLEAAPIADLFARPRPALAEVASRPPDPQPA